MSVRYRRALNLPELCRGDDSLQYQCGAKAANELDEPIDGRPVSCEGVGKDQYGELWRFARLMAKTLGYGLCANGFAFDRPRYSKGKYAGAQREAEREGRGIWAGSYAAPWAYRACIRNSGRPGSCSDEANVLSLNRFIAKR